MKISKRLKKTVRNFGFATLGALAIGTLLQATEASAQTYYYPATTYYYAPPPAYVAAPTYFYSAPIGPPVQIWFP